MLRSVLQFMMAGVALGLASSGGRDASPLVLSCEAFPNSASLATVRTTFAVADVATDSVPLGAVDGQMVPASVLFPRDPTRRIEIVWKDTVARRDPRFVRVAGGPTQWRTADGITIGTPLRELERLNGRPFHLAGFAFDAAGAVVSWNGGRLETPPWSSCQRRVYVDSLTAAGRSSEAYRTVRGDREFSSHSRAMQTLNPRVSSLLLEYP